MEDGAAWPGGTRVWMGIWMVMMLGTPVTAAGTSHQSHLEKIRSHSEVITPRWLTPSGLQDKLSDKYPTYAEVMVMAEGRKMILTLQRNEQLIHMNYRQIHYSSSDIPIVHKPNMTDHCYYHGAVRGEKDSGVTVSTCSGIRGLITLSNGVSYVLEPLPGDSDRHLIYRVEYLEVEKGKCGHLTSGEKHFSNSTYHPHNRVRREDVEGDRCVELYLVADYAEFEKHDFDLERTQRKMLEVTNYIDKFYRALKIRIALIGLEVWTTGDKCNVSENPYVTLRAFLSWRRKILLKTPHDNAQLITGRTFHGTTIGLAPLQAMCSSYQSGGVNMDHSDNAIGVAATMAHEMGHNFGMSHDAAGCCTAKPDDGGCIMAAATGHPFPKVFNACNRRELDRFLRSGGGMCLSNIPDTKNLYGGARCGNGFLEEGEQCDCGDLEQCDNPCCNATTCTLLPGAECAHGTCCHHCKLRPPGFPCRKTSRACDLPEFCTGHSAVCPANSFQMDGTSCQNGEAFCYNGRCLTHQQQCQQLWGNGASIAPNVCFERINAAGDQYGNCGRDMNGEYRKCETKHAKCGKIQCLSSAFKPIEQNSVAIDTTITVQGRSILCRGTHVYRITEEEDMMDPGLVLSGTKCGVNELCFEGQCKNISFLQVDECAKKCNGNGICNNNQNCHCLPGWRPPYCNQTGNGGSLDSGPVPADSSQSVVFWIFIPLSLLAGIILMLSIYLHKHGFLKKCLQSDNVPVAGSLHKSESGEKARLDSSSRPKPQTRMCPKRPINLQSSTRTEEQRPAARHQPSHHPVSKQLERGAVKNTHQLRIPPPSRPPPPPPTQAPTKALQPPRKTPPPVPPSRTRLTAKV
ncbi:disintegrin and metalloproteinase domain-containing protein 19 isoform X1 [Bufo gargarizans]|uniref:disintegrin and metalloproteinase domain-containing protein 19 isoform X1 n=2 Tax=Bufo gargarizans TaxID=30331 RepID=UPI001CF4CDC2|nr:disintegrin and metalloproteinase domain-containing protein 19 isoform X1 [Bufo gargarizans]